MKGRSSSRAAAQAGLPPRSDQTSYRHGAPALHAGPQPHGPGNYVLGQGSPFRVIRDMKASIARILELSDRYVSTWRPTRSSPACGCEQQRVEILKVLYHGIELLTWTSRPRPDASGNGPSAASASPTRRGTVRRSSSFRTSWTGDARQRSLSVMRDAKVVRTVKTSETNAREWRA